MGYSINGLSHDIISINGDLIDFCDCFVARNIFEGLQIQNLAGNIVEEIASLHQSILSGTNENKKYIWKMCEDYVIGLVKLREISRGSPKTIIWQTYFKQKLVKSDQVSATFFPV